MSQFGRGMGGFTENFIHFTNNSQTGVLLRGCEGGALFARGGILVHRARRKTATGLASWRSSASYRPRRMMAPWALQVGPCAAPSAAQRPETPGPPMGAVARGHAGRRARQSGRHGPHPSARRLLRHIRGVRARRRALGGERSRLRGRRRWVGGGGPWAFRGRTHVDGEAWVGRWATVRAGRAPRPLARVHEAARCGRSRERPLEALGKALAQGRRPSESGHAAQR